MKIDKLEMIDIEVIIHEDTIDENKNRFTKCTYIIGKKKYNYTIEANFPSDEALRNLAKEILKH